MHLSDLYWKAFVYSKLLSEFLNAKIYYFMLVLKLEKASASWAVLYEVCVCRRGKLALEIFMKPMLHHLLCIRFSFVLENYFDSLSQFSVQVIANALFCPTFPSIPITHPQCLQNYLLFLKKAHYFFTLKSLLDLDFLIGEIPYFLS